jgi:hypothetical protein
MPIMHVDDTSLRVDRKNQWIHVCSAGDITLKFLHPKRGQEAIEDIIPRYGGVVIHDCWQSYLSYDHCGHGLKWLSLGPYEASAARNLHNCARRESKQLSEQEYKNLQKDYRNILDHGEKNYLLFLQDKR